MRTSQELALLDMAIGGLASEDNGNVESPVGYFWSIPIDNEARECFKCEDSDAQKWLESTVGTTYYILRQDSNGILYIEEYDNEHDSKCRYVELESEFYSWDYEGIEV